MDKIIMILAGITVIINLIFVLFTIVNAVEQSKLIHLWNQEHRDWMNASATVEAIIDKGLSCTFVLNYTTYHLLITYDKLKKKTPTANVGDYISIKVNPDNLDEYFVDESTELSKVLKTKLQKITHLFLTVIFILCIIIAVLIGIEVMT